MSNRHKFGKRLRFFMMGLGCGMVGRAWSLVGKSAVVLVGAVAMGGVGQGQGVREVSGLEMPEAPGFVAGQATGRVQTATAGVSGVVLDINGAPVPGAKVIVSTVAGVTEQEVTTGIDGQFSFAGVKAERITVTITAPGLESFVSNEIRLTPGEAYELPKIALPVMPANTTVNVTVTEDELATAEVKEQEKQRVLGVIPNFYTSYLWNAAPMRNKQKFHLMLKAAVDPETFVVTGIRAGVQQYRGTYPGYGDGATGFLTRFGADYGDSITGRVVGRALLPVLFHQDPRYFYLGTGSKLGRFRYALLQAVECRGDNGKTQVNFSGLLGNMAAASLRNVYLPRENRNASEVLLNGVALIGVNALANVVREFLPRRAVTNLPEYKKGKPARQAD